MVAYPTSKKYKQSCISLSVFVTIGCVIIIVLRFNRKMNRARTIKCEGIDKYKKGETDKKYEEY